MTVEFRAAGEADFDAIVRLNLASESLMSAMPIERLRLLHGQAAYHKVATEGDQVVGFLLAFREGSPYDSVNYRWFAQRYERFLYIDRIAVAETHRGQGVGAQFYEDLFATARSQGVPLVTCEFDVTPPNPASARFHARFGFREVGSQRVQYADKTVSLQVLELA
jgi:predicted GNAT superfamily acetyltransferase